MGGELAADQRNQVGCALAAVVVQNVGAGDAACFFALGVGEGPHARVGKAHVFAGKVGGGQHAVGFGN